MLSKQLAHLPVSLLKRSLCSKQQSKGNFQGSLVTVLPHSQIGFQEYATKVSSKKSGKGKKGDDEVRQKDKKLIIVEEALKSQPVKDSQLDASQLSEDMARAKEYSRLKMAEHRKMRAGESVRLKLKLAAIAALPEGRLREAAMVPDYTPFPVNRIAAALSPPMEGFIEQQAKESERSAKVKKIR